MSWKLHGLSSGVKAVLRAPWGGTLHQLGDFLSFLLVFFPYAMGFCMYLLRDVSVGLLQLGAEPKEREVRSFTVDLMHPPQK